MPIHSARPFIVRAGKILGRVEVDRGEIPIYVAEIAVARAKKIWESSILVLPDGGPSLSEIERAGGFDPERLLDLLAGGDRGAFDRVWNRALPDADPARVISADARRFPLRGGPATDGTGVAAGFVPLYLAQIAFALFRAKAISRGVGGRVPSLGELERSGGFAPHELLDVLCGGDGSGGALAAMNSRAVIEARSFVRGMKS